MNNSSAPTAQSRTERRKARQRQAMRQRVAALLTIVAVSVIATAAVIEIQANEPAAPAEEAAEPPETSAVILADPEHTPLSVASNPPAEAEPVAVSYISDAVPLSYELQAFMLEECKRWGCPYALALAVAEVESQFNMEAIGAVGEVGIMQLNPGPGGSYHDELEAATGLDPTTPEGNISGGVYLLGSYMTEYDDPAKATMAYNMGHSGALKAWAAGVTTSDHVEKVLEAMIRWGHVLDNLAEEAASNR